MNEFRVDSQTGETTEVALELSDEERELFSSDPNSTLDLAALFTPSTPIERLKAIGLSVAELRELLSEDE